jgi:3-(3-hydroxy-phenyl)propionate hydroxylase
VQEDQVRDDARRKLLDEDLLPWFARYGVQAVAVRPDKFIAAADKTGLAVPTL